MTFFCKSVRLTIPGVLLIPCLIIFVDDAAAANQTNVFSPVTLGDHLPYQIEVRRYDMGATEMPTLHSFAAAEYGDQWVIAAGLTNGLHGFDLDQSSIPTRKQNREIWVVDPITRASWHRTLDPADAGSGLTEAEVLSLTTANSQSEQVGDRLYMTGGYGDDNTNDNSSRGTFSTLTAFDLPELVDWVKGGSGLASDHIRQLNDPFFKVTGGDMYKMGDNVLLVFGQNYEGRYRGSLNGTYTKQVRVFTIQDDGMNLGFEHIQSSTAMQHFRRRDLNVYPTIEKTPDGSLTEGLTSLSGVFTESFGAWTVPVEIDVNGNPLQIDNGLDPLNTDGALDRDSSVFKQAMNNYHSAKVGLFSESTGDMHELLFGGITLQEYDPSHANADANGFVTDLGLPNTNQISSVIRQADGSYHQQYLGEYPTIFAPGGGRMRFGSNAQFFLADNVPTYKNGVVDLDALSDTTILGYIYGGLIANAPHVFGNPTGLSSASGEVFQVMLTPVPEPESILLACATIALLSVLWHHPNRD